MSDFSGSGAVYSATWRDWLLIRLNLKLLAEIRLWVYRKLEPLVPAGIMGRKSGDVLAILTSDIDTLENLYVRVLAPPVTAIIIAAGMYIYLSSLDYQLGLILMAGMLIGGGILPIIILKSEPKSR